jgi:hypothetical protein
MDGGEKVKLTLYGVRAIRTTHKNQIPEETRAILSEQLQEKYEDLPETYNEEVCRIMTGPKIGRFIPLNQTFFSGDCLTNIEEDAEGFVRALAASPLHNISYAKVFSVILFL